MKKRGFTLIELLVVIAIIAILAAILFPVFSRAREQARKTQCLSNMKQIASALMMYVQDWDGAFPTGLHWSARASGDPGDIYWSSAAKLLPYLKNCGVWDCPSAAVYFIALDPNYNCGRGVYSQQDTSTWGWPFPRDFVGYQIDIGQNNVIFQGNRYGFPFPLREADIAAPAQLAAFFDSPALLSCVPMSTYPNACAVLCTPSRRVESNSRHVGGSNFVFCDGHAKWLNRFTIMNQAGLMAAPTQYDSGGRDWWSRKCNWPGAQ